MIYRICAVNPDDEMDWKGYAVALLVFSILGSYCLFILLRIQNLLPLNPTGMPAMPTDTALNTAVSFVTNTNWQNYSGERSLSYLSQMVGLTVQNFLSAASGMAVAVGFIRAFARQQTRKIGNFWVDLTRSILYILLPASFLFAFLLVSQGVVQTFSDSITVKVLQPYNNPAGEVIDQQVIAVGPAASQIAIKHLGTNGGGFFNANAAHPFENPNAFTNILLILAETIIPAALVYTYGKMVGDPKQGWVILIVMIILLVVFTGFSISRIRRGNPQF